MATRDSREKSALRSRIAAVALAVVSVGSMLFLFLAGGRLYPESEAGIWLLALAVLLPFVTLLALVIQVRALAAAGGFRKRAVDPTTRLSMALLGPIGMAWAVFVLTRRSARAPAARAPASPERREDLD